MIVACRMPCGWFPATWSAFLSSRHGEIDVCPRRSQQRWNYVAVGYGQYWYWVFVGRGTD